MVKQSYHNSVTTCKINNAITPYDFMSSDRNAYERLEKSGQIVFLGQGITWEVDGVQQNNRELSFFWKKAKNTFIYDEVGRKLQLI